MKYTLGIDLGTTFSVMAIVDESGRPVVLKNSEGSNTTPSVIYFGDKEPIVGEEAKEYQAFGEKEIAAYFKRSMGDSYFLLECNGRTYDTIELSSIVLKKIKRDAEAILGVKITNAVITVPAYFNNKQREATIKAGELAGLNVLRIINEPTAAAIAYGMDQSKEGNILVYDLGGGTFDVTLASINDISIDVLATDGDHSLGGKDWDDCIALYISERFQEEYGIDPMEDDHAFNSILVSCEKAKKQLSARDRTMIKVVYDGKSGQYELTKDIFVDVTQHLLERTWSLSEQVLESAKMGWHEIDEVILVGGATRMPMVVKFIESRIGRRPKTGINVDEVVACGAAIQAAVDIANQNQSKPAFAIGAAKNVHDVMSHSLGMVAINDDYTKYINSRIISKNGKIPCTEDRPYQIQTSSGLENMFEVYVTQGESDRPMDCDIIGKYVISGVSHVEKGQAIIDVSYSYNQNGIVQVTAVEKSTGRYLDVSVEPIPSDLSWLNEPPVKQEELIKDPMSVLIAIDLSYSMQGIPLNAAQKAAKEFVNGMDLDHTSVGIIGFADHSQITLPLMSNYGSIMNGIDLLGSLFQKATLGYGNAGEPFTDSLELFKIENGRKFIIVLTDGMWADQNEAIRIAKCCHNQSIEVIAIGFGSADESFLKKIATADENALTTDLTQIVSSFLKIAQVLSEQKKSSGSQALRFFT